MIGLSPLLTVHTVEPFGGAYWALMGLCLLYLVFSFVNHLSDILSDDEETNYPRD